VTTVDVYDKLLEHPNVMSACDKILANIYAYWEGADINQAVALSYQKYQQIYKKAGESKSSFPKPAGPAQETHMAMLYRRWRMQASFLKTLFPG